MNETLCHLVGDYLLQSHWMATNKTTRNHAAAAHVTMYMLPFLLLRPSTRAIVIMAVTHYLIDRYRLARYVVWAKDWIAPRGQKHAMTATGMQDDIPPWLSTWLLIIADNTIHLLINRFALRRK